MKTTIVLVCMVLCLCSVCINSLADGAANEILVFFDFSPRLDA